MPGVTENNNWYEHGFVPKNDYSVDLKDWYGIAFELELPASCELELLVEIGHLINRSPLAEEVSYAAARVIITGQGVQRLNIPFSQFDDIVSQSMKWKFVRSVRITGYYRNGGDHAPFLLSGLRFMRRKALLMTTPVWSQGAEPGQKAVYDLTVVNCSIEKQGISLLHKRHGWESMSVKLEPEAFVLEPGGSRIVRVSVDVSDRVAPGGHEKQRIYAIPGGQGDAAESIELITLRSLPYPYILMTDPEWADVRRKIESHAWAEELLGMYVNRAEVWIVPQIQEGPYMFETHHSHEAQNAAIAWKLTSNSAFADKVVLLLQRLIDPAEWV